MLGLLKAKEIDLIVNQVLKEKVQSIEIHWMVYHLFDNLSIL